MTSHDAMAVVSGAALVALVLVLASVALRAPRLWRREAALFACPRYRAPVKCWLIQDLRTGQRRRAIACSAFAHPYDVSCPQECVRLMNLGLLVPRDGAGESVLLGDNGPRSPS